MVNAIVILILILIAIFAIRGTIKHMKGESPCCGGGGASEIKEKPSKDRPDLRNDLRALCKPCNACFKQDRRCICKCQLKRQESGCFL